MQLTLLHGKSAGQFAASLSALLRATQIAHNMTYVLLAHWFHILSRHTIAKKPVFILFANLATLLQRTNEHLSAILFSEICCKFIILL